MFRTPTGNQLTALIPTVGQTLPFNLHQAAISIHTVPSMTGSAFGKVKERAVTESSELV